MAKAKKPTTESTTPEAKTKKPTGAKKSAAKVPALPAGVPMIDTNLAAATAAKAVAHKDEIAAATGTRGSGESAAFKQMKDNLHKPVGQNTPSFLHSIAPAKKFNPSIPGRNQQIGRNQTFGADVNRTGVPRRTGGG